MYMPYLTTQHKGEERRIEGKKIEENEFENNFEVAKCIGCTYVYVTRTYIQSKYERESRRRKKNNFFLLTNKTEVDDDGFINSKEIYIQIRKT